MPNIKDVHSKLRLHVHALTYTVIAGVWPLCYMMLSLLCICTRMMAVMTVKKAINGFLSVWCSTSGHRSSVLRVEVNFHRDQSRLSFWLATGACSQSKQQYLWDMLSWHQIWTYLQDTYIHTVRISQLCITTGSMSKRMLFIFRATGEDR